MPFRHPALKVDLSSTSAPRAAISATVKRCLKPPTFTMLTTEPGPDVVPIHNRQIVVLRPEDWTAWVHLTIPETDFLKALPAGSLASKPYEKEADKAQPDPAPEVFIG